MRLTLLAYGLLFWFGLNLHSYGQLADSTEMIKVELSDEEKDPVVLVYHSIGNINVEGHLGKDVFVYKQELLPSINSSIGQDSVEHHAAVNQETGQLKQINRSNTFLITEQENIVRIETSIFSFNTNVFVMVPTPSAIAVSISDMGNIEISDIQGDVEAITSTGNIFIHNVTGSVVANTQFGSIVGNFSQQGVKHPLWLTTLVGNIEVIVPKTTKSTLDLYSEWGTIFSNFNNINSLSENATHTEKSNRKFSFKLNGGGIEFVVRTIKGDIYLRHIE